jgi:LytS/YehU family sensor histidine kinase
MSTRFGDRLTVELSVAPEARGCTVPVFLFQPLVENAIQHGVTRRAGPGKVEVSVTRVDDTLRVEVADDGPGIEGDPEAAVGKGIGLRNTRERLLHLYGEAASLSLRNGDDGGLRAVVAIPYRETDPHTESDRG